jgi:hypothetical protein
MQIKEVLVASLIVLVAPTARGAPREGGQPTGTVHLQIVHAATGEDLGMATVSYFARKVPVESANLASNFHDNVATEIPYGFYHLRARTTGFWSAEKDVFVDQATTWVVLGLTIGMEGYPSPPFRLSGTVQTEGLTGCELRMRLIDIFADASIDAMPDSSGKFTFAGVFQGTYVLTTLCGQRVLNTRPVQIPTTTSVRIELQPPERPESVKGP